MAGKSAGRESASDNFKFSAAVAEFGLILRNSEFKGNANFEDIISLAQSGRGEDSEGYRGEFIKLVQKTPDNQGLCVAPPGLEPGSKV